MAPRSFLGEIFGELLQMARISLFRVVVDVPILIGAGVAAWWRALQWLRPLDSTADGFGYKLIAAWIGAALLGCAAAAASAVFLRLDEETPARGFLRRGVVVLLALVLLFGLPTPSIGRVVEG